MSAVTPGPVGGVTAPAGTSNSPLTPFNNTMLPSPMANPSAAMNRPSEWAPVAYKTLAFCGGIALGGITYLGLFGVMSNPIGFIVAGSVIALALALAAKHGGWKEFKATLAMMGLGLAISSFLITGPGLVKVPSSHAMQGAQALIPLSMVTLAMGASADNTINEPHKQPINPPGPPGPNPRKSKRQKKPYNSEQPTLD